MIDYYVIIMFILCLIMIATNYSWYKRCQNLNVEWCEHCQKLNEEWYDHCQNLNRSLYALSEKCRELEEKENNIYG